LPFETLRDDAVSGFGIPAGTALFGSDFSLPRFQQRKEYLDSAFKYSVPERREVDVAIASELPGIVDAWKACARAEGGMSVRFEPQSQTDAIAFMEFFGPAGSSAKLLGDVGLPDGITAVSGRECLRKDRIYKTGEPCIVVLSLPTAPTSALLAANTDAGLAVGYLAPRVKLSFAKRPFPFTPACALTAAATQEDQARCKDRLFFHVRGSSSARSNTVTIPASLPADLWGQGWEFDTTSGRLEIRTLARHSPSNTSHCQAPVVRPTALTFVYGYTLRAGTEHGQAATLTCMVEPAIDLTRPVWVPKG
jgi:hypothetical protein